MKSDNRDELESIIDGALAGYSATEPLAGIEKRVLRRISLAEAARRSSRILGWAVAFPILISMVVLAIAVWLPRQTQRAQTSSGPPRLATAQTMLPAMPRVVSQHRYARAIGHLAPHRSVPRQKPLPAPTPITAEERALLALITRDPAEATQAFAELRKRGDQPIDIQEIQIQPLQNSATESAAQSGSAR